MKKCVIFLFIVIFLLTGCSAISEPSQPTEPTVIHTQIANPWKSYGSLEEAENACSLTFPIPMTVADIYTAESFRVMNAQLLEVIYRAEDEEVIVRMQSGKDCDISGVYADADSVETTVLNGVSVTTKQMNGSRLDLISMDGYSFSVYSPSGYCANAETEFLSFICNS